MNGATIRSKRTNAAATQNYVMGGLLVFLGLLSTAGSGIILILKFFASLFRRIGFAGWMVPTPFFVVLLLLGIALFILGGKRFSLANRFKKLDMQLNLYPTDTIENISGRLMSTPEKVLNDIVLLQRRNFWRAVTILDNAIVIESFTPNTAYRVLAEDEKEFSRVTKRDRFSFPILLLILLCIASFIPTSGFFSSLIVLLLAFGASFALHQASGVFYRPRPVAKYGPKTVAAPLVIEIEKSSDEQINVVLRKGEEYLNQLAALRKGSISTKIAGDISDISASLQQLLNLLKEEPDKIRQVQQLMNYSLPTTIRLLNDYNNLSSQPIKGENILASMQKIEGMCSMVANTFRKELDSLYQDRSLNIEVDIEVMESMLNQGDMNITNLK